MDQQAVERALASGDPCGSSPASGPDDQAPIPNGVFHFGFNHQQLVDVASVYEDLKKKYGSNVALTGQSLGGGLAVAIAIRASAANDES